MRPRVQNGSCHLHFLRKIDPYESYNQFDWKAQWQKEGDLLARYLVRVGEMRESIRLESPMAKRRRFVSSLFSMSR
jgi:NADH:ubiquinone oxidoreductase subunit D